MNHYSQEDNVDETVSLKDDYFTSQADVISKIYCKPRYSQITFQKYHMYYYVSDTALYQH